jgi:hypothetical protein
MGQEKRMRIPSNSRLPAKPEQAGLGGNLASKSNLVHTFHWQHT